MDITNILTNVVAFAGGALFVTLLDAVVAQPLRKRRHARYALKHLSRMLYDSYEIYQQQLRLRELLVNSLLESQPSRWQQLSAEGFNAAFTALYADMNAHQRELLVILRSLTEQGLYRLNTHMLEWVEENSLERLFSPQRRLRPELKKMDEALNAMKLHLKQWVEIYQAEFAKSPHHGLVFVGDPDVQQNRFPQDLKPTVEKVLGWYK